MIIAQLSDPHIAELSCEFQGLYDTAGKLRLAIDRLNKLTPRPDIAMMTGDLVNTGTAGEYAILKEILEGAEVPIFLGIGNHDNRDEFQKQFSDLAYLTHDDFIQYVVEMEDLRLIMLDTNIPGKPQGILCEERLQWLDEKLAEKSDIPTIIFMHHPPIETGIQSMDAMGLMNKQGFEAVVARHDNVIRICCGHLHRTISSTFGGRQVLVCPSTSHKVMLDLTDDKRLATTNEPSEMQLHLWTGKHLTTHNIFTAPHDIMWELEGDLY